MKIRHLHSGSIINCARILASKAAGSSTYFFPVIHHEGSQQFLRDFSLVLHRLLLGLFRDPQLRGMAQAVRNGSLPKFVFSFLSGLPAPHTQRSSSLAADSKPLDLPTRPSSTDQDVPESPLACPPALSLAHSERGFRKLGWLPAPPPPNESERLKSLYRYGILSKDPDNPVGRNANPTINKIVKMVQK